MSAHSAKGRTKRAQHPPDPLCDRKSGTRITDINQACKRALEARGERCKAWKAISYGRTKK